MRLMLFNSGSGRKEPFRTLKPGSVSIYVCGVTPYDTTHIGHAFTYLSFDALIRYLVFSGLNVNYTQNVTDIDDDVLRKAREQHKDWRALGTFWTRRYLADMKGLNALKPTHYVKATGAMPQIIRMVAALVEGGFAYESAGNVYFNVKKFPRYGRLSHYSEAQMRLLLKERGGDPSDPNKRNPLDFIVWQAWKEGEPYWSSPWGRGRPGWHIECSAMIREYLGERIDIHGGGRDLIFPHHESEIAQSESFTGKRPFSRYFMHTAMVMRDGEKMSKSLGNLVLVSDLLKRHSPNAVRWLLLSHHYRRVWEFMQDELDAAESTVERISRYLAKEPKAKPDADVMKRFSSAMDDDLDTPAALDMISRLCESAAGQGSARQMMRVLGFIV